MTTSTKQINANRKNAKKGGVKTKEGKERSKMNALKHGLLSTLMFLPGEDPEVLANLIYDMRRELLPQGLFEYFLVDRIVSCIWRLRRVMQAETTQIIKHYGDQMYKNTDTPESDVPFLAENSFFNSSDVDTFLRYETTIERQLYRAFDTLVEYRILRAKYREIGVRTNEPQIIK